MKCIMTQKWISYAHANALDGVFDRNRTGIPAISSAATVRVSDVALQRELTPGYELGTWWHRVLPFYSQLIFLVAY